MASAIVCSRLDYCNAILCHFGWNIRGQPRQLQRVQNTLARVVTGSRRHEHIHLASPRRSTLTSNPCKDNIQNCLACLKIREEKQSMYLAKLMEEYKPVRELRSTSRLLLKEPCIKTNYRTEIISLCSCQDMERSSRSY